MSETRYTEAQLQEAQRCIDSCAAMRTRGDLEDALRHNLSSFLRPMFPSNPRWVDLHIQGSEAHVQFSRNRAEHYGFVDSLVGATAIEYESNLEVANKFDTGYYQVKEYCAGLLNQGYPIDNIRGVLSDTVLWHAYSVSITTEEQRTQYGADDLRLDEIERLDCSMQVSANYLLLDFLNRHLGRLGSRVLNAHAINLDLGFESVIARRHLPLLASAVDRRSNAHLGYAEMIENLWIRFVNSIHDTNVGEEFDSSFYVDEFYVTTIAKCLCANVLSSTALISNEEQIGDILGGQFFRLKRFENIVEYDFFGWLNAQPLDQSLVDFVKEVQLDLRAYDYSAEISEDLFSKLFSELANKSRRLLLGQAMTPQWLVEKIVRKGLFSTSGEPRYLDMCCGSGTFVVEIIKQILAQNSELDPESKMRIIRNCVTGFDIDPLAVLLAKINWVMSTKSLWTNSGETVVTVPIYNADSLFAVTPVAGGDVTSEYYRLRLLDSVVDLPKCLLTEPSGKLFEFLLNTGDAFINGNVSLPTEASFYMELVAAKNDEFSCQLSSEHVEQIAVFSQNYYATIFDLHEQERNGIWNFLIRNSYRPALVENSFNGILSNPPWLTLSRIADNPYRAFLLTLGNQYNILPTGSSFLHVELATIFLIASIDRYLEEDGFVGCIVPGTVMSGDHQHEFRSQSYRRGDPQLAIEQLWELDADIFNNIGAVVIGAKSNTTSPEAIQGLRGVNVDAEEEVTYYYSTIDDKSTWCTRRIQVNLENSYYDSFSQGADIMPRTVFLHEVHPISGNDTMMNILPISTQTSEVAYLVKGVWKLVDFRTAPSQVESSCIYPYLSSKLLLSFFIAELPSAVLPIRKQHGEWELIPPAVFVTKSVGLRNLFDRAIAANEDVGNMDELWQGLNERNKLVRQQFGNAEYLVISGTGGAYPCAHYLSSDEVDFDRIVIDQTINYCEVETEAEALYLVGLLNSAAIADLIGSFQAAGSFGKRHIHSLPYRVIPPFDAEIEEHCSMVSHTRQLIAELRAHFDASSDDLVLRLLNPNASSLAHKRRAMRSIIATLPSYDAYELAAGDILR